MNRRVILSLAFLALAATRGAERSRGGVVRFDGASGGMQVGHCEAIDLAEAVTVEAWIKPQKMGRQGGRIVDKGTAGTKSGFTLDTFPGNSLRLIVRTSGYEGVVSFAAKLAVDRWTHVVGAFSAAERVGVLYVNGKEVARKRFAVGKKMVGNDLPLFVGSDHAGENRFLGEMDRVTVYKRMLTGGEVAKLAAEPGRKSLGLKGRVADWGFDKLVKGRYVSTADGQLGLKLPYGRTRAAAKLTGRARPAEGVWTLWYRQPAGRWLDAMPIGNGRLGAMVFGGVSCERLQLNEDTLWSGGPHCYDNPKALRHLAEVRKLIAERKFEQARVRGDEFLLGIPRGQQAYQPLGNLWIRMQGHDAAADYRRELDLASAVARVSYRVGDARFTREVFASCPDQVLAVRLTCDKPGKLSFELAMDSPHPHTARPTAERTLTMSGQVRGQQQAGLLGQWDGRGLKFESRVAVSAEGGRVTRAEDSIEVEGADAVTLLQVAATGYKNYRDVSGDAGAICGKRLAAVAGKSFDQLRRAHVADHGALFGRVEIDLGGRSAARRPTDERVRAVKKGADDPLLVAQSFQFGRYLLIASSRPGTQPANLQGIWNDSTRPPWGSKWTLNINAEMNYWPAETCNLAECHEPLLRLVEELREPGRRTAKVHYGCRGFVTHHNADLWRGTAPVDGTRWGLWPMGAAWLCRHLWEHYDFGRDRRFLRRVYPTMKEAAEFFVDYLQDEPSGSPSAAKGAKPRLVTWPGLSFEQGFRMPDGTTGRLCMAPTMDMQILRDLFGHCIRAAEVLDVDANFRAKLADMRSRLVPTRVNPKTGRLCEWRDNREPDSIGTGQLAQLWGLSPGDEITPWHAPALAAAARKSLEYRHLRLGSWCSGTRVNFWARLGDGEGTYKILQGHMRVHVLESLLSNFNARIFQIDGNLGVTAGIAEMLLQSHGGRITLLPALPKAWPTGSVKGLRARGGLEVDIVWRDGKLRAVTLRAKTAGKHAVHYGRKSVELDADPGKRYRLDGSLRSP